MNIKGKQTENNVRSAISGEAQAALLYDIFARRAKKDGFEEIARIFQEISTNEKAHAKIYLELLSCISTTDKNLLSSAETELHEHSIMYPEFAQKAREEGLEEVAKTFEMVAEIEKNHEDIFRKLLCQVENNSVFDKGMEARWICQNCGYRHTSSKAPDICPVCKHPRGYFSLVCSTL